MGFDYDKIKARSDEGGSLWTSYSDLFMMLSVVFLLLYVTASLRTGSFSLQKNMEYQQLARQAADLQEQIRVYNALRDEQLKNESEEEQKVYHQLMSKLTLLQDEAREEKEQLRRQARENEEKEFALNKYQQLIRNIVNTNILAKGQIKRRDQVIETKEQTITESKQMIASQDAEIQSLNKEIESKAAAIEQNKRRITAMNREMAARVEKLKEEQKKAKTSKQALEKAISELQAKTQQEIRTLESRSRKIASELKHARSNLEMAQSQVEQKASEMEDLKKRTEEERSELVARLESTKSEYQQQIQAIQETSARERERERREFQESLNKQKLTAAARAQKEAEFRAKAESQARELAQNLSALESKVSATEQQLQSAKANEDRYIASISSLKKEKSEMAGALERAQELANARKKLAERIKSNFARAGIPAQVDGKTGDVVLSFGEDYFDTGSSALKPTMQQTLDKFIPSYARSLFSDSQAAKNISNVEIIGFASSTYKGKYVNPKSLKPEDREAIDYNLRLSFARANSIFKHVFDTKKLTFEHQQELLPLVKVVGRGYLPEGKEGQNIPEGMREEDFCKHYNCKAAQRVIVRFNLKD